MLALATIDSDVGTLKETGIETPLYLQDSPVGLPRGLRLTFDEFLEARVEVKRFLSGENNLNPVDCTIHQAARDMRVQGKQKDDTELYCYSFSYAFDEDFDEALKVPQIIQDTDLYTKYWPFKNTSQFLRERSKLFYGFQKGYKSAPQSTYGGLAEWIWVILGTIEVTLIRPTEANWIKYSTLDEDELFVPQEGTTQTHILKPDNFIVIPAGWICIRRAVKDSFAFAGEFLHYKSLADQLEIFMKDVIRTNSRFAIERDTEIRACYWLSIANMLNAPGRNHLKSLDRRDLEQLKFHLDRWKELHDSHETPYNLYVPGTRLNVSLICRDLKSFTRHTGRSLKSAEDSIDIFSDQTATYNQPD